MERITKGELDIPMDIWNSQHFIKWYKKLKEAGNHIDGANLLWSFYVGPNLFAFVLKVNIYVTAEKRNKTNEFIISRPDISTIIAYYPNKEIMDTEIVLIKEFRSTSRTNDGFIRDVPGGSCWKEENPKKTIIDELKEETGLKIKDLKRIKIIGSRQINAAFSTHCANVFSIELTKEEMKFFYKQEREKTMNGLIEDSEITYIEIHKLRELIESNIVDWGTLGMICATLYPLQ